MKTTKPTNTHKTPQTKHKTPQTKHKTTKQNKTQNEKRQRPFFHFFIATMDK
jgi:hypothetical protein